MLDCDGLAVREAVRQSIGKGENRIQGFRSERPQAPTFMRQPSYSIALGLVGVLLFLHTKANQIGGTLAG